MPPKPKITKSMLVEAAFSIARTQGAEQINARTVSQALGCSTQPVMYHFATMNELRKAVYEKADSFHTQYLMEGCENSAEPMLDIGLRYIRFAAVEPHLFRFLFQSNAFSGKTLRDLIEAEELEPVLSVLRQTSGLGREAASNLFFSLFLVVHGYASLLANHAMEYDEADAAALLTRVYLGVVSNAKEETQ